MKYNELPNKVSVRWHPTINRWCLYLRSKSTKAYHGVHNLLALPSQQTLFDYINATKVGTGFKDSAVHQLVAKAMKLKIYEADHTQFVGIILDEVQINSDLVFNKHSGELVGYVDLDHVSSELLNLELIFFTVK